MEFAPREQTRLQIPRRVVASFDSYAEAQMAVDYPAGKEDLISTAKSNDASQGFIQDLGGLAEEGSEYNSYAEVLQALRYEAQEERHG